MKDNLSIVISMVIFVILIVIFPLYNYFERQDDMSYNLALKATTNFVDEITESGYLDQDMYDRFVDELANTGNVYDIQLEAHKRILTQDDTESDIYNEQYLIDYNNQIFSPDTGDIKSDLNERTIKDEAYYLNEGDQFYVKLKNSNTTMAGAIFNTIVPASSKDRIVVNYGGIIKNQAWVKVDAKYYALEVIDSTPPSEPDDTPPSEPVEEPIVYKEEKLVYEEDNRKSTYSHDFYWSPRQYNKYKYEDIEIPSELHNKKIYVVLELENCDEDCKFTTNDVIYRKYNENPKVGRAYKASYCSSDEISEDGKKVTICYDISDSEITKVTIMYYLRNRAHSNSNTKIKVKFYGEKPN